MKTRMFAAMAMALLSAATASSAAQFSKPVPDAVPKAKPVAQTPTHDMFCSYVTSGFRDALTEIARRQDVDISGGTADSMTQTMNYSCLDVKDLPFYTLDAKTTYVRDMMRCTGTWRGIYNAYLVTTSDKSESDTVLNIRWRHAVESCSRKPEKFLLDMFNHGPEYVTERTY